MIKPDPVLKRLRKQRGLLKHASREIGVTRAAIVRWDNMTAEPTRQHRVAYAQFLGISVGQLGALIYEESVRRAVPPRKKRGSRSVEA